MNLDEVKELLGIQPQDSEWDDLDNMVHEQKAVEASAINNDGIDSQIQFLLDSGWGRSDFQSFLEQQCK